MCLISFGDDSTRPPALPCSRDGALVDKGATAPKPCLSPMEMRMLTVADGLVPAGTASTATMTIFHQLPLWFCLTQEMHSRTSIQYATTYSSFWKLKILQTKARQTLVFDPGGSPGRLHACPFLGTWRALLREDVFLWAPDGTRGWSVFWQKNDLEYHFPREVQAIHYTECIAVDCCLSAARPFRGSRKSQMARDYESYGGERMSGNVMERGA